MMHTMKSFFFISFACLMMVFGCVAQKDIIILQDHIAAIEQRCAAQDQRNAKSEENVMQIQSRMETYGQDREEKDAKLRNQAAGMRVMLNNLRTEIQIQNGRLEETEYLLKQKLSALENLERNRENRFVRIDETIGLNKDRIIRLEEYLNFEPLDKSQSKIKTDTSEKKELTENELYTLAKKAFDKGDFEAAREGFQKLIKRYAKSSQADNAQFWIGEIYYREKWYEKAILEYQKVIEKYPKGNKVPSALLKQGFAFYNLGDKANSRLILKELEKKYPGSNEGKIARQKLKGLK